MRERKFEKLHFQNFTIRLSNQSDIFEYDRSNFMYVKTFISELDGGNLQECGDFTWRVSDCEELYDNYPHYH